jgi:hypothetical protein
LQFALVDFAADGFDFGVTEAEGGGVEGERLVSSWISPRT